MQGLIRVVLYLQDLGLVPKAPKGKPETVSLDTAQGSRPPAMGGESANAVED